MTTKTATANLKCLIIKKLYQISKNLQAGECTKFLFKFLKENLKFLYFQDCGDIKYCEETVTSDCTKITKTCDEYTGTIIEFHNIATNKFIFTAVLNSTFTYTWNITTPFHTISTNNNICEATLIGVGDVCSQPITLTCTITDSVYGCNTIKLIDKGIGC